MRITKQIINTAMEIINMSNSNSNNSNRYKLTHNR